MNSNEAKIRDRAKQKKEMKAREDFVANRMLLDTVLATVLVFVLLILNKNNINFDYLFIARGGFTWLAVVSGVIFVGALVFFIMQKLRRVNDSGKFLGSGYILGNAAALILAVFAFRYFYSTGAIIVLVATMIVYFIYSCYQKDMFVFSALSCIEAVLIYVSSRAITESPFKTVLKIGGKIFAIVLPLAILVLLLMLHRHRGNLVLGNKKIKVMRPAYKYYPLVVGAVMTLLFSVFVMFFPSLYLYSIIAFGVYYLVIAVIYTVDLIKS